MPNWTGNSYLPKHDTHRQQDILRMHTKGLFTLRAGVPNPAPADRLSCTVHLQPKSNTPAFKFQVILKILNGCFRCVWLDLEINCAGQSIGRSRVGHTCFNPIFWLWFHLL